jgi:hypothetical protein
VKRNSRFVPAPHAPLKSLEKAAQGDLRRARQILGLFDALVGGIPDTRIRLFPGSHRGLLEVTHFPERLRREAKALANWAVGSSPQDLGTMLESRYRVEQAVRRIRQGSKLGQDFCRRAARLMRSNPPLAGQASSSVIGYDIMPEEVGKPLCERVLRLAEILSPRRVQVVPYLAPMNHACIPNALTIRLAEDEYTIDSITITVEAPAQTEASTPPRVEGELIGYFETGCEGVIWSIEDDSRFGRDAMETICEGDYLTIVDQLGKPLWKGMIRCDKRTGWCPYPMNPKLGQQSALGHWVHWIQKGFKPDAWASYFIRPQCDRFRGILVPGKGLKRDPRLGPEDDEPAPPTAAPSSR